MFVLGGWNKGAARADDLCHELYPKVTALLRFSETIRRLAEEFAAVHLVPPFAAVHVRPYPDACLEVWAAPFFNETREAHTCYHRSLRRRLHEHVVETVGAHNITHVFVMAHPSVENRVLDLLANPHFALRTMHLSYLERRTGWYSTSLLSFVQQVAEEAALFIGSIHSSITGNIMGMRAFRPVQNQVSLTFPCLRGERTSSDSLVAFSQWYIQHPSGVEVM